MQGKLLIFLIGLLLAGVGGAAWFLIGDDGDPNEGDRKPDATAQAGGPEGDRPRTGTGDRQSAESKVRDGGVAANNPVADRPDAIDGRETGETSSGTRPSRVRDTDPGGTTGRDNLPGGTAVHTSDPAPVVTPPKSSGPIVSADGRKSLIPTPLGGVGEGEARVADQRRPATERHRGFHPKQPVINDEPKRLLRGRVVEKVGASYVGLPDVMVVGWRDLHRTFTDQEGWFEFEVRFGDGVGSSLDGKERDSSPSNDVVYLKASADGYVMTGPGVSVNGNPGAMFYSGRMFSPEEVNSADGPLIELKYVGLEQIKVKIVNPPSNVTEVGILVESYSQSGAHSDDWFQIAAQADSKGEARFSVPNRGDLKIRAVSEEWRSAGEARYNNQNGFWELTLVEVSSNAIKGQFVDVRTGLALPAVRVVANNDGEATYSDAGGNFELMARRDSTFFNVICEHPRYLRTHGVLNAEGSRDPRITLDLRGTAPLGPWRIEMRPAVRVTAEMQPPPGVRLTNVKTIAIKAPNLADRVVYGRVVNGAVVVTVEEFPWGATGFTIVYTDEEAGRDKMFPVEIPMSMWNQENVYQFRLFG